MINEQIIPHFCLAITINSHILLRGPKFLEGGRAGPLGPLAGYVPDIRIYLSIKSVMKIVTKLKIY